MSNQHKVKFTLRGVRVSIIDAETGSLYQNIKISPHKSFQAMLFQEMDLAQSIFEVMDYGTTRKF